jgi:hypothetical protein
MKMKHEMKLDRRSLLSLDNAAVDPVSNFAFLSGVFTKARTDERGKTLK